MAGWKQAVSVSSACQRSIMDKPARVIHPAGHTGRLRVSNWQGDRKALSITLVFMLVATLINPRGYGYGSI